jgi:hypothetical protein
MAAISQKIPSLVGGVSQQPDSLKLPNQLRECVNYYPDPTFGLAKRPGLKVISKLNNSLADGTWFTAFRDEEERYIIEFAKNGTLRIWDAESGVQQTVNTPAASATTYASHISSADLSVLQINDYIFVLNRSITVTERAAVSPAIVPYGYFLINAVSYNTTYSVTLNSTTYSYNTPATSSTALNLTDITGGLVSAINAGAVWTATAVGNCIHVVKNDNANFSIKAQGGTAGNAIEAFKKTVSSVAELPRQFLNGKVIEVLSSADSTGDNYYVKFQTSDNAATGAGVWEETVGPEVKLGLNPATMPHAIIREANGTFTYRQLGEAEAAAITPTASIAGVPSAVTITTSNKGRYSVGESFPVYGGTGINLRLRVTAIRTDNVVTNYTYSGSSVNFVERSVYPDNSVVAKWYLNGTVIRITSNDNPISINNLTISKLGSYTPVTLAPGAVITERAGVTTDAEFPGRIDGVQISRAGRAYTANDVVISEQGDTFTITTVATVTQTIDAWADNWWQDRIVGDENTNPPPTFVNRKITGMSFFKNRLVLMSGENIICSQAGSYFDFYASTVIASIDSDPIDLSCGSLKPIQIRYAIQMPRGLALFADNAQYVLETTTDAFSASTAEINLLGSYNQNANIPPVDVGDSIIFTEQSDTATGVFEMLIPEQGLGKPRVAELTRIIPSYLPSDVLELKATSSASTFGIRSARDLKSLYFFRFFNSGNDRQMASWFKWILPGDVDVIEFDHDRMFIVYTTDSGSKVLCHVNLLTDSPGGALFFENRFVDLRLDCYTYNPTLVYDSGSDTTRVCFKDGTEDGTLQPCLVSLDSLEPGVVQYLDLEFDNTAPVGEKYFVEIEGDQTSKPFALGYQYISTATLPAFYLLQREDRKDTLNIPRVNRMSIDSYESGPFEVTVKSQGREPYTLVVSQTPANSYPANTLPMLRNAQNKIPVMAKGTEVEVDLIASTPFPSAITSITWEGTYNNKGIRTL